MTISMKKEINKKQQICAEPKKPQTYISDNLQRESIFLVGGDMNNQIKGSSTAEVLKKYKYGKN